MKKGGKRTAKEINQFLEASYRDTPPEKIGNFILDKELSKKTATVYYNPTTDEAVVAHRGTLGLTDWANNLAYAVGAYDYTPRYKQGKSIQDKAEAKFGKDNISTLGHSQGSIIARKTGKDTKEIINVNPAYTFETPAKNEYTIRSSGDVVSSLYAPVAKARKVLYPKYSEERDIIIPAKSKMDILGEHSYNILNRLENDREIGENNISTNTIMKGGKRSRSLGYDGDDIDFIGGGIFTGGSVGTAYENIGTTPYGVIGGANIIKSIGKSLKKVGKSTKKTFAPVGKSLDTASKGLVKATDAINPMTYALKNKGTSKLMAQSGDTTHDYILPAVVSAGKPIYDATMMAASTAATGNPLLGKVAGDTLWNEMVAKKGYNPEKNQKSKELGQLSGAFGKAVAKPYSAGLGGFRLLNGGGAGASTVAPDGNNYNFLREYLKDYLNQRLINFFPNNIPYKTQKINTFVNNFINSRSGNYLQQLIDDIHEEVFTPPPQFYYFEEEIATDYHDHLILSQGEEAKVASGRVAGRKPKKMKIKGGMMNEVTPQPTPVVTPTGTPVGEIDDDILQELINIVTQRATPQRLSRFRQLVRGNISGFITTLNGHFGNLAAQNAQRVLFERHFPDYEDSVTVGAGRKPKKMKKG